MGTSFTAGGPKRSSDPLGGETRAVGYPGQSVKSRQMMVGNDAGRFDPSFPPESSFLARGLNSVEQICCDSQTGPGQQTGVYLDFSVSSLSKVRNGPAIVPCRQTTNKSQVAPASAMGTMATFGTFR